MPSYDLVCRGCGTGFEVFRQRLLRDEDRTCPHCGADDARTRLTGFVGGRARRSSPEPRVTGVAGTGCCGGRCRH
jgi:putative FmdB family regulatory protein